MSFYCVNPGLVNLFNYFVDKQSVEQINSNVYNPFCGTSCKSSSGFGYFFDEYFSSVSGSFLLYVSSNVPHNDVFTLRFYQLNSSSSVLDYPIVSLKGYPDGAVLNDSYMPISINVGNTNVYLSNDRDKCLKTLSLNKIWFRLLVGESNKTILQLKINNSVIYSYTLELNTSYLGNTIIFSCNDASISNILLSSSYDEINEGMNVVNVSTYVSESDMISTSDGYIANSADQKTIFNINSSTDNTYKSLHGVVIIKDSRFTEFNSMIIDQTNTYVDNNGSSVSENFVSSRSEYEIPQVGDTISFFIPKDVSDIKFIRHSIKISLGHLVSVVGGE